MGTVAGAVIGVSLGIPPEDVAELVGVPGQGEHVQQLHDVVKRMCGRALDVVGLMQAMERLDEGE